jgi:hypothetical protein
MVSCSCLYASDEEFPSISWCIYGFSLLICVLVAPICMYYCWSRISICGVEVSGVSAASVICSFVYAFCVMSNIIAGYFEIFIVASLVKNVPYNVGFED